MANATASSDRRRQFFDPRVVARGDCVAVSGSVTIVGGGVDRTMGAWPPLLRHRAHAHGGRDPEGAFDVS